jgi:murein DD-endopeptidase MepM/ murein hydrolase activator NlpD
MAEELKVCSPTAGVAIRKADAFGAGHFGAARGSRLHAGVDYSVEAGQDVYSPIAGKITRKSYPYVSDLRFEGVVIKGEGALSHVEVKLWYLKPIPSKIGERVQKGEKIGVAQDLEIKYKGINNHIHMNLYVNGATINSLPLLEEAAKCTAD